MSQSIDFRINDFVNEYLDYKGFHRTVESFTKEREQRQEPLHKKTNGHHGQKKDSLISQTIRVLKYDLYSHLILE
jgi:hypothetical protein